MPSNFPTTLRLPTSDPISLGCGLHWPSGRQTSTALLPLRDLSEVRRTAQDSTERVEVVDTRHQYLEVVEASVSGSGSTTFGSSASAAFSLLDQVEFGESTLMFVGSGHFPKFEVAVEAGRWAEVQISTAAMDLLRSDEARFLAEYGSHFASGVIYGTQYNGATVVETTSVARLQALKAEVKGEVKAAAGTAAFEVELKRTIQASTYATHSIDYGQGDLMPGKGVVETLDALKQCANAATAENFLKELKPIGVVMTPYSALPCVQAVIGAQSVLRTDISEQQYELLTEVLAGYVSLKKALWVAYETNHFHTREGDGRKLRELRNEVELKQQAFDGASFGTLKHWTLPELQKERKRVEAYEATLRKLLDLDRPIKVKWEYVSARYGSFKQGVELVPANKTVRVCIFNHVEMYICRKPEGLQAHLNWRDKDNKWYAKIVPWSVARETPPTGSHRPDDPRYVSDEAKKQIGFFVWLATD